MAKVLESRFKIKYDWFKNTLQIISSKSYNSSVISARLRKLEEYFNMLTEVYENILCADLSQDIVASYDEKYKEATDAYNQLDAVAAAYPSLDGTHLPTESVASSRLPRINLMSFDGDVFSWTSFISLFTSLVLSRKDISKTEKFHYLISNLEKEPQALIRHLPMIDSSLDTAMDILKGRYENKRLQADSYISRILHLPALNKSVGLRATILNPLLESTRALTNLGLPVDQWSYMLLHISLTKLPLDIKTRFEQMYGGNNLQLPTFDQLTEFLQNECRLIDTAAAGPILSYADHTRKPARAVHVTERGGNNNTNQYHTLEWSNTRNNKSDKTTTCVYCQLSGHNLTNCFKFANLSTYNRKDWIRSNGLCFRCFGNHAASACARQVPCNRCGNNGHHKLICTMSAPRSGSPADNGQRSRHAMVASQRNDYGSGRRSPNTRGTCDDRMHQRSSLSDNGGASGRMRELMHSYECENTSRNAMERDRRRTDLGNRDSGPSCSREERSPVSHRNSRAQQ
jgi:hypothetical protein